MVNKLLNISAGTNVQHSNILLKRTNVCFTWFAQLIMENSSENYVQLIAFMVQCIIAQSACNFMVSTVD